MAHDARPASDAYVAVCGTLSVVAADSENGVPPRRRLAIMEA
jgi:hypothetical protein